MFDCNRLKDPAYFRENRVEAHSDHECLPACRFSLNGLWKFFHARNPAQVIPGFEQPEFDCRGWNDIHVPAHIQTEGWGNPQYSNQAYPWDGLEDLRPGQLPESFNPVACYVKHFRLPEEMKGKRVFISFQGAESCVALWLNGTYICFSSDSFTPHEFELTGSLQEGENKLACRVYRWCAGRPSVGSESDSRAGRNICQRHPAVENQSNRAGGHFTGNPPEGRRETAGIGQAGGFRRNGSFRHAVYGEATALVSRESMPVPAGGGTDRTGRDAGMLLPEGGLPENRNC